jgi:uncharacterized membrane protein
MDAVITPHRSLTPRGVIALIGVVTLFDTLLAIMFVKIGAAPIPIFLGIGLFAVVVAILASNRAAKRCERIRVTAAEVKVLKEDRTGSAVVWVSPTAFTRVSLVDDESDDQSALHLHVSDRALSVAAALSRRERRDFARALDTAIARAKAGAAHR